MDPGGTLRWGLRRRWEFPGAIALGGSVRYRANTYPNGLADPLGIRSFDRIGCLVWMDKLAGHVKKAEEFWKVS